MRQACRLPPDGARAARSTISRTVASGTALGKKARQEYRLATASRTSIVKPPRQNGLHCERRRHKMKVTMIPIRAFTFGLIALFAITPSRAMVGGAPPAADGAGQSVVMILGSGGTACTATAIARDLLLTAAHCVQPDSEYKLVASAPGERPVLKDIVRIERDPQFDLKRLFGHLATADVALIKLAEPLPARIPPVRIGGDAETVAVGDPLIVAGYGVTVRGDGRTGGTVRSATLVATGVPGTLQIRLFDP